MPASTHLKSSLQLEGKIVSVPFAVEKRINVNGQASHQEQEHPLQASRERDVSVKPLFEGATPASAYLHIFLPASKKSPPNFNVSRRVRYSRLAIIRRVIFAYSDPPHLQNILATTSTTNHYSHGIKPLLRRLNAQPPLHLPNQNRRRPPQHADRGPG